MARIGLNLFSAALCGVPKMTKITGMNFTPNNANLSNFMNKK